MVEADQIWQNRIFPANVGATAEEVVLMKVQARTVNGYVALSPVGRRDIAVIAAPEVLLKGGVVEAGEPLGTLVFPPHIGKTIDTKV